MWNMSKNPLPALSLTTSIILQIWTLHNPGLHSRSTPFWRRPCDEMDMTLWVQGVKACFAVSVHNNNNNNKCSTFVPLDRYQLCNVVPRDMTIVALFLNIRVFCSFTTVTLLLSRLLVWSKPILCLLFTLFFQESKHRKTVLKRVLSAQISKRDVLCC